MDVQNVPRGAVSQEAVISNKFMTEQRPLKIKKRDGRIVDFDEQKIVNAIARAAQSMHKEKFDSKSIVEKASSQIKQKFSQETPTVEQIQDTVEKVLMEEEHHEIAKAYILYRQKRKEISEIRTAILEGKTTSLKLSENALMVLKERYLRRDEEGKLSETPEELFMRVAENIAQADKIYKQDVEQAKKEFYEIMANLEFLPNSPTLMNAGNEKQQLMSCFVIPVGDSIEEIFDALKYQAIIHKTGGGTGFSFSRLRPKGDYVKSMAGVSAGTTGFMKIFDAATQAIIQGGKRKGANMAILKVDHPDIIEFITLKENYTAMQNFNLSVGITQKFMDALKKEQDYELIHPKTKEVIRNVSAKHVFDLIVSTSWKTGDPGVVFLDRMNDEKSNPTPTLGEIETTSPCGEKPLLPYESVGMGAINLAKIVEEGKINWDKLRKTTHKAVHFLDNMIEVNKYPIPQTEYMSKMNRKIGLGIMGFADMLFQLKTKYDSEKAIEVAKEIMNFISTEADNASTELARLRGPFQNQNISTYKNKKPIRNATRTAISPTGTRSIIADCSPGIEPLYALSYTKKVMEGKEILCVNPYFEKIAKEKGFYSEELMKKIANKGTIQDINEIPQDIKEIFRLNYDIDPYWQILIQATFQKHIDCAVSKTVNFPKWVSTKEVAETFMQAYNLGCKGITIYRDGSRSEQTLNVTI